MGPQAQGVREMAVDGWLREARASWRQGEHVALIGPTGSGKTTLARAFLAARAYVCVLAVKTYDDTLDTFKRAWRGSGGLTDARYRVIEDWPPSYKDRRVILWIKPKSLRGLNEQAEKLYEALQQMYRSGGWCIFFDDLSYICGTLNLSRPVTVLLNQGRSAGISAVVASTRPRKVPLEAFNQCRIVVAFRFSDARELERIAEIAGVPKHTVITLNGQLREHDFLAFRAGQVTLVRNSK